MTSKALRFAAAFLLAIAHFAAAQTPGKINAADGISAAQARYRDGRQKLEAEFDRWIGTLRQWYLPSLEKLQADFAKKADLDSAVAVKGERERIAAGLDSTPEQIAAMPPALRALRTSYETSLKKIQVEAGRRDSDGRTKYLAELEALQKRITVTGDIEQALLVKTEKERFNREEVGIVAAKQGSPLPGAATAPISAPTPAAPAAAGTTSPVPVTKAPSVPDSGEAWSQLTVKSGKATGIETKDGWLVPTAGAKYALLESEKEFRDCSIRLEAKWVTGESPCELGLRASKDGKYYLKRQPGSAEMVFAGPPKKDYFKKAWLPEPEAGQIVTMEFTAQGRTLIGKIDGQEVLRTEDDRLKKGKLQIVFYPTAAIRNIEYQTLTR